MIEVEGIRFVVEAHRRPLVAGLRIEIQRFFGREGLVAYGTSGGGAC